MSQTPLVTLNEGKAEVFKLAVQQACIDDKQANAKGISRFIEELDTVYGKAATEALESRAMWKEAWRVLEDEIRTDGQLEETGCMLRDVYTRWLETLTTLCDVAQGMTARGHPIANETHVRTARAEIERYLGAVETNWPWPDRPWPRIDPKMIEESRAQIARGEGKDIEDLIRELQGRRPLS
jgi:hypothetical protein